MSVLVLLYARFLDDPEQAGSAGGRFVPNSRPPGRRQAVTGREPGRTRMWRLRHVATRFIDPLLLPVATRLPTFGALTHVGRTTGRVYHTPINLFRRGDEYLFFLTYGSDVQWVKNVLAGGSCSVETGGGVVELVEPELITDRELRPAPPHVRFFERRIAGATQYLRMRVASTT